MTEQMKTLLLAAVETMVVNLGREFVCINITDPGIIPTTSLISIFIMHFIVATIGFLQLR